MSTIKWVDLALAANRHPKTLAEWAVMKKITQNQLVFSFQQSCQVCSKCVEGSAVFQLHCLITSPQKHPDVLNLQFCTGVAGKNKISMYLIPVYLQDP